VKPDVAHAFVRAAWRLVSTLVLLCPMALAAQTSLDPFSWFPLRIGSRWIYEHEWKSGNQNNPEVRSWTTSETVTNLIQVPEGIVVIRSVEVQGGESTGGYVTMRDTSPYLLHSNCIYGLDGSWDRVAGKVRPDFLQYLANGTASPDFCFPLQTGQHWGTMDLPWQVQDFRNGIFQLVSHHFGSGGQLDVRFKKNVGIVSEHYLHHGTYDEYTKTLKSFTAAPR
jgi:hypothetical protein